jgi:hypothetical protein
MKQMTVGAGAFERYGEITRQAAFLAEEERVVPRSTLCARIEPVYPKALGYLSEFPIEASAEVP